MSSIVQVSEAVTIGVHAMLCLSMAPDRYWSAREIVARFHVSEAHLAKVMAALARAGIVTSVRGPHGGSRLSRPPGEVTLLQIYEAIDGPMTMPACLLSPRGCGSTCCQIGPALAAANQALRDRFASTTLADVTWRPPAARKAVPA